MVHIAVRAAYAKVLRLEGWLLMHLRISEKDSATGEPCTGQEWER